MKVFDKVFPSAPFFHANKYSQHLINTLYFTLLSFAFLYVLLLGYRFLGIMLLSFFVAFVFVWIYQFFDKRLIFNSKQWAIYLLLYLFLIPHYATTPVILTGIVVLFVFGYGILSVSGRPILSPLLLAVLAVYFLSSNNTVIIPQNYVFPRLFPLVFSHYDYNVMNLGSAISDTYKIIAGNGDWINLSRIDPNTLQDIINQYPDYIHPWDFWGFRYLINANPLFIGGVSVPLLFLAYLILSIKKIINPLYPFLYIWFYILLVLFLYYFLNNMFLREFTFINTYYNLIAFLAIFVMTDYTVLPIREKVRIVTVFLTVLTTVMLNMKNVTPINLFSAMLSVNMLRSLLEIWLGQVPFSFIRRSWKRIFHRKKYQISMKENYSFVLILGVIWIAVSSMAIMYFPHDIFIQNKNAYYKNIVQNKFPNAIISGEQNKSDFFTMREPDQPPRQVIIKTIQEFRVKITLIAIFQEDTIESISALSSSSGYISQFYEGLLQSLQGSAVAEIPMMVQKFEQMTENQNTTTVLRVLNQNLLSIYATFTEFKQS